MSLSTADRRGQPIAAREYANEYRVSGRGDLVRFLVEAVAASGARVLNVSSPTRAPFHIGLALSSGLRAGASIYAFRVAHGGRSYDDEWKIQIRYGSEESWRALDHPIGHDPAGVDVTMVLGIDLRHRVFIGLDPALYDPLPMGISIEYRQGDVERALADSWHVWERETRGGSRREARWEGLETLVAFTPDRFVDFLVFEAEADALGLDHALRYRAAQQAASRGINLRHELERAFELSAGEILDVIAAGKRLGIAVRGGVAERHLARYLRDDPEILEFAEIDEDDRPDFEVALSVPHSGQILVECKNASPEALSDGVLKVEVQKTRGKVPERLYEADRFDVVAACLWSATGSWDFLFAAARDLDRHDQYPDRLKSTHRIDDRWQASLGDVVKGLGAP